ncbi:MAG: amino acid permease, partial [Bryobacteraceae bacterium]
MTPPKSSEHLRRAVRLPDLVLLNITAVVGVRWLAVAARTGPGSITLWVSGGLLFFIPSALVVAGLSKRYPEEGGLYVWTREAFGPWHGFLCGACYFVSNLFYLPSALLYGLSIAAVAFGFSQDKALMIGLALVILWSVASLNLLGAELGKWTSDMGGMATFLVGGLLMAAG